jgi:hypothetical protein
MEFIEKIVGHIAWPLAAIFIVAQFKNEIQGFVRRIRTAKYKDVELSLGQEIQFVKQEAEAAGITIYYPEAAFSQDAVRSVESEPEWAFIKSWQEIETLLTSLYRQATGNLTKREPIPQIIKLLAREGVIQQDLAELVSKIRDVRNKIIHLSDSELTKGEALEWLGISKSVKDRLQQRLK